jgi:hypothetical protein
MVIKDGIVIGEEKGIQLKRGEQKTINITIVIIINQIFNITNIVNNQNVMINNITFSGTNGTFDSLSGNEYRVSFICVDTVYMSTNITIGSTSESVIMKFIKQPGGTYTGVLEGTLQQIKINTGATIINNGNGSDSSTVSISGKIKEEVR